MVQMTTGQKREKPTKDEQINELKKLCSLIEADNVKLREQLKNLNIPNVSQQSELLIDFLIHLNNKKLINNHDFDYEKEAKKYAKKLINSG